MYLPNSRISLSLNKYVMFLSSFITPENYTRGVTAPHLHAIRYKMYNLLYYMELNEITAKLN